MKKPFVLQFTLSGFFYRAHFHSEQGNIAQEVKDASRYATHQEASRVLQRIKDHMSGKPIVVNINNLPK